MSDTQVVFRRQQRILRICTVLFAPFARLARPISWVVGPEDIALMSTHIARALPGAFTAIHARNPFYDVEYDALIQRPSTLFGGRWAVWRRLYGGPLLLAWLINRTRGFIYVGGGGFLEGHHDEREFEFAFIRKHRRRIVCYFTGNDIRSPVLSLERARVTGEDNIGSRLVTLDPVFATPAYDDARRARARVAERQADAIFTARIDQIAYLDGPTEPFLYFAPDDEFVPATDKFERLDRIVVLHAPSSPHLKGTETVREVMARIVAEYPSVEYRELSGVPHAEVLAALDDAHIVVNELYGLVPGVFGIEAMARRCVVVTRASVDDEPELGEDARGAWVVAGAATLERAMRDVLDDPGTLARRAALGWDWARAHASATASRRTLIAALADRDNTTDRPR